MKLHELTEAWVVKNKDGKEKRFKDQNSQEAKDWKKASSKKSVKTAVYSQKYWEAKENDLKYEGLLPWSKITENELSEQFEGIAFANGLGRVDDYRIVKRGEEKVDGVDTATAVISMVFSFGKEDDIGLAVKGDERVSDKQVVQLRRDAKTPKKLIFAGYA